MQNEHRTYRSLWVAARRLRIDASSEARSRTNRDLGALLCLYFAFEGFLNDLGDRIAADTWAEEREFFGKGEYRGTLGKLRYLAEISNFLLEKGRRPYQTLRELEAVRHELVHPRTIVAGSSVSFDPDGFPKLLDPDALRTIESEGFPERAFTDIEALADALVSCSKNAFPAELRYYGDRAFEGAIAGASGWGAA